MSVVQQFELRCSDVHPNGCGEVMCGHDLHEVLADVQLHGEVAHGYTPSFYDRAWRGMVAALRQQQAP